MAILTVANIAADFGGSAIDTTSLNERDAAYSPTGIQTTSDNAMAMAEWVAPSGDLWFHFRWLTSSFSSSSGADGYLMSFYDASGNLVARVDYSNGGIGAQAIGDSTVSGTYNLTPDDTKYTLDVRVSLSGGNITVDLYSGGGGAPISTAVAANVGAKTAPVRAVFDMFDIDGNASATTYFSEIIVTDSEDTRGWRLATLEPNTNGNYNQWVGDVNELGDGDTATAIATDTNANRQSWNPTAYAGPASPSSIRAVIGKAQCLRGISGSPSQIAQFLRISATDYDGAAVAFAAGEQKPILTVWDNNPATASPWATADLASLELGLLALT